MNPPTEPSILSVRLPNGIVGYVAVVGWEVRVVSEPCPSKCVRFTHENLSSLRRDNFHVNLLATVKRTLGSEGLSWVPFPA